jgi:thymidylate kinase
MMLHPELEALFLDPQWARLRWCVLRLPVDTGDSDAGRSSGDIDVLVDRAHLAGLRRVLGTHGFVQLPGWSPGLHYLRYHQATDCWLWLHVVTELSYGPYALLGTHAESGCLDRRLCDGIVPVLAPDDAFWSLLLHCLADKGRIAQRHRTRLQELSEAAREDSPIATVVAAVCPPGLSPASILALVHAGCWDRLEQQAPALIAPWMRHDHVGTPRIVRERISRVIGKLRHWRSRRGLSVAVLGPDGAGKSTLVTGLLKSFILPARSGYMGLTGGMLRHVDKLVLPVLILPGHFVIFWWRYLVAQYHQLRGRLVVFDRYTYDAEVPTPKSLDWMQRLCRRIDGHAVPAPDLVIVLDAPGAIMYQRKGEYSAQMLEDWRQHFLNLTRRIAHVEIVDAARPIDVVRADVTQRIWEQYTKRWSSQGVNGPNG